VNQT